MKTINFLFTTVFILLLGSCTNESQPIEEDLAATDFRGRMAQEKDETQEIFEVDLRQFHTLGEIYRLTEEKKALEEDIERGNEKLIPNLEYSIEELSVNYKNLEEILDITCYVLKVQLVILERNIKNAEDGSAELSRLLDKLSELEPKLEVCGVDVKEYVAEAFEEKGITYVNTWGTKCMPGRDYKCKKSVKEGRLLINVEEELMNDTRILFKSIKGEIISTGKTIGNHEELKRLYQIEIEINQLEQGILEISSENGSIDVPIEVQR